LAFVTSTIDFLIVRSLFVMAMSMQELQITVLPIASPGREFDVVEFN